MARCTGAATWCSLWTATEILASPTARAYRPGGLSTVDNDMADYRPAEMNDLAPVEDFPERLLLEDDHEDDNDNGVLAPLS